MYIKPLRIWFACVLGVAISTVLGWSNAMFMALTAGICVGEFKSVEYGRVYSVAVRRVLGRYSSEFDHRLLDAFPALMTAAVGIMLLFKCIGMHHKSTYLFGYTGLLLGSIMLNFGRYQSFDLVNFILGIGVASLMTLPICALAFYLFPDREQGLPVLAVAGQVHAPRAMVEQTALGWMVAMVVFIIFQFGNLNDSLSAQASMLIMLAPMTLSGSLMMAKIRIIGTVAGCMMAMAIQLLLYDMFDNPLLYLLGFAIWAGIFCRWLANDGVWSGIGFSALSALTIPLTNTIVPGQQDAFFAILYRASSIVVAVIATSVIIWLGHRLIQSLPRRFELSDSRNASSAGAAVS